MIVMGLWLAPTWRSSRVSLQHVQINIIGVRIVHVEGTHLEVVAEVVDLLEHPAYHEEAFLWIHCGIESVEEYLQTADLFLFLPTLRGQPA